LTALNTSDVDHQQVMEMIRRARGPYVLPVAVLSELTFMIERDYGSRKLEEFLASIIQGQFVLDCGERDIERVLELVQRYSDFSLGFADAAVAACAERNGGLVATLDYRHFGVIAREGVIELAI
jgi:predicted nucleic acid-binding protein